MREAISGHQWSSVAIKVHGHAIREVNLSSTAL